MWQRPACLRSSDADRCRQEQLGLFAEREGHGCRAGPSGDHRSQCGWVPRPSNATSRRGLAAAGAGDGHASGPRGCGCGKASRRRDNRWPAGQPRGLSCCDGPDRPSPPTWTRVLRQRGNEKRRNRRKQRQRQRRAGRFDRSESWRQEQSQLRASGQDRGCCHGLRTGRANLGRIATVSLPMFNHAFPRSEPACLNPFAAGQMWTHQSL